MKGLGGGGHTKSGGQLAILNILTFVFLAPNLVSDTKVDV